MSINKTDTSQTTYSYYAEDISRVMCLLQVTKKGLSSAEVLRRQKKYGMNQIRVPSRLTTLTLFLNQFKSTLIIALSIAGIFSIIISLTTSESKWIEAIVIFLAVFTNVALGFWQEHKAEKSLELLHTYTKIKTIVIRNGATIEVDAHDLVPGDIIIFKQGDRIPADARIIKANDLSIDESALTGESLTVSKDPKSVAKGTSLGDRTSMVYSGTSVVEGSGEAVVTHTGDQTEFGVIAKLVANKKQEDTPLQKSIKQFSVKAGSVLFVMGIVLFLLGFFIAEKPVIDIFFIAVAAIVSAVPEGLPIAVTVVLAIGVDSFN